MGTAISGRDAKGMFDDYVNRHGHANGRRMFKRHLTESFKGKHLSPYDFSIRELFESFIPGGREIVNSWQNLKGGDLDLGPILEAAGGTAVGYSDFSNITGQIFFTEFLERYEDQEFVFSKEIESKASTIQDLERIPGITRIGSTSATRGIAEGQPYPHFGVGENYIEVPAKVKDGGITEVTKEAVAGDKTGQLLENLGEMGYWTGYGVEERTVDAVIDANEGATSAYSGGHRYTWRGTAYATYQASTPWINLTTGNALASEDNVDVLWRIIYAIKDPFTNKPITIKPTHLVTTPQLAWKAGRIVSAQEFRSTTPGYATTGAPSQTLSPPAILRMLPGIKPVYSQILADRMTAAGIALTRWFLGDLRKAIRRYFNWDVTTAQRSTGTDAEFERDIVMQWKASLKDCLTTREPRAMAYSDV